MLAPAPAKIRCRQITSSGLAAVARLLAEGFPRRRHAFWQKGLERMARRQCPEGSPQFGYCLDADGQLVGVILMIASQRSINGVPATFTNLASWYVKPEFRPYAHQLAAMALKNRTTSYVNVTAAPSTWPVVESQGYRKYCNGLFFAWAALAKPQPTISIHGFSEVSARADVRAMAEFDILQRHAQWGCTVLVVEEAGKLSGFVFRRLAMRSGLISLPAMFAIHAPSRDELVRLAGNFGRYFIWSAAPILVMDANGPVPGLRGLFTEKRGRKFAKGPLQPDLCNLADTELAIFGI
jgi:hypothetical protein